MGANIAHHRAWGGGIGFAKPQGHALHIVNQRLAAGALPAGAMQLTASSAAAGHVIPVVGDANPGHGAQAIAQTVCWQIGSGGQGVIHRGLVDHFQRICTGRGAHHGAHSSGRFKAGFAAKHRSVGISPGQAGTAWAQARWYRKTGQQELAGDQAQAQLRVLDHLGHSHLLPRGLARSNKAPQHCPQHQQPDRQGHHQL